MRWAVVKVKGDDRSTAKGIVASKTGNYMPDATVQLIENEERRDGDKVKNRKGEKKIK